jgi:hypothetical protein
MIKFQREMLQDCVDEVREYFNPHGEVENMKVLPNVELYLEANNAMKFIFYTVRDDEELVGYTGFWVGAHPHHKDKVFASNDLIYIRPDHRGETTLSFFEFLERQLDFVDAISYTMKTEFDHPKLMEQLGMTCTEKVYTKVIR